MTETDYLISQLAEKAGVSVRTIRFYIDEGLLPAPQTRGRYTVYSDEYLDRLELIRRLKEAFLPLKEIRQKMNSLSWEEVKNLLGQPQPKEAEKAKSLPSAPSPAAAPAPAPAPAAARTQEPNSALEYVNRLLSPAATKEERLLRRLQLPPSAPQAQPTLNPPLPPERWDRISLAPGLELHVRQPTSPETRSKIDQILDLFRSHFV